MWFTTAKTQERDIRKEEQGIRQALLYIFRKDNAHNPHSSKSSNMVGVTLKSLFGGEKRSKSLENAAYSSWHRLVRRPNQEHESILRSICSDSWQASLNSFGSTLQGLDENEAAKRLALAGPNSLSSTKPASWLRLLMHSVLNPFNALLAIIATVSAATPPPSWSTFTILIMMISLSVGVRFWQELKSSLEVTKLQSKVKTDIKVRRKATTNSEIYVDPSQLVPGDVLVLDAGDSVPADCLILESSYLQIAQSALTGESEPVSKSNQVNRQKNQAIFDQHNLLFMGTTVISGRGLGLVLATGDNGLIATITSELNKRRPMSAFEIGIRKVTYMMIILMIIMVTTILVIQGEKSKHWPQAALFSLAVSLGIVPEMLPAILNINLARGAYSLSQKRAIVRRLEAVQNLGGMTVLCCDKTGTLTKDEIALYRAEDSQGKESTWCLRLAYTNAANQGGKMNSIDNAIVNQVDEKMYPVGEKVLEVPFNFEKRRSVSVVREMGRLMMINKGAFEEILELCTRIRRGGNHVTTMDLKSKQKYIRKAIQYSEKGYRVLAICTVDNLTDEDLERIHEVEQNSIFEGLLTFIDPAKDDAEISIAALQRSGVQIKILTGDGLHIATNVCRSLSLHGPDPEIGIHSITGPELAHLSESDFREMVQRCSVFAKLTPKQKGVVITCLKLDGHTVGMLGDGINDCVALRLADVGISVNTAVNVAKDCADIILTEKDLSIIVDGVMIGRLTHGNTMKYIKMVTSSNFGNVLSVLIASAWLPYQPILPIQIIIQNLLYDISQTVLPWDTMDAKYLAIPHKWSIRDLVRFIVIFGPTSSSIDMITFSLNWFFYNIRTADSSLVAQAQTHFFLEGFLTQTLIVHMIRTSNIPFFQSRASNGLIATTCLISIFGLSMSYIPPLAKLMGLVHPAPSFLGFLCPQLLIYVVEVQLVKMLYIRMFKVWL